MVPIVPLTRFKASELRKVLSNLVVGVEGCELLSVNPKRLFIESNFLLSPVVSYACSRNLVLSNYSNA